MPAWVMVSAVILLAMPTLLAAGESSREYQIKAAFIYNFTQFVEWPAEAMGSDDAPIVVAVVGQDPFEGILEKTMEGKTVRGRRLVVKHFADVEHIGSCHVLFISDSEVDLLDRICNSLKDRHVLTIAENERFSWAGGMVRFYTQENKIHFEINVTATEAENFKISSKLLNLAKIFRK